MTPIYITALCPQCNHQTTTINVYLSRLNPILGTVKKRRYYFLCEHCQQPLLLTIGLTAVKVVQP